MKITKVKIRYLGDTRLKALFSITFNNCLTINDCSIIIDEEKDMKFIAFPFTKNKDGEMVNLAHPLTPEFRTEIEQKIFELYDAHEEEYTTNGGSEMCKITGGKVQKIEPGIFEVRLIFDDIFAVSKMICKIQEKSLLFRHPYSKEVDGIRYNLINFENQILIQDITMWLAKNCMAQNNID